MKTIRSSLPVFFRVWAVVFAAVMLGVFVWYSQVRAQRPGTIEVQKKEPVLISGSKAYSRPSETSPFLQAFKPESPITGALGDSGPAVQLVPVQELESPKTASKEKGVLMSGSKSGIVSLNAKADFLTSRASKETAKAVSMVEESDNLDGLLMSMSTKIPRRPRSSVLMVSSKSAPLTVFPGPWFIPAEKLAAPTLAGILKGVPSELPEAPLAAKGASQSEVPVVAAPDMLKDAPQRSRILIMGSKAPAELVPQKVWNDPAPAFSQKSKP